MKKLNKEDILKSLILLKKEVNNKYKAEIKGIFGSYVRNEETKDSDIDILVSFDEEADLLDFSGLSLFLQEKLDNRVDIVPIDFIREEIKDYILLETIYI